MKDKEGVRLIIVQRVKNGYKLNEKADNTIATRVSAGKLTQAIMNRLELKLVKFLAQENNL